MSSPIGGLRRGEWAELERIEREALRLDRMIEEILTLARLEEPSDLLHHEVCALDEILDLVAQDGEFEGGARGVMVTLSPCESIALACDAEMIRSAIENLVRNAIRHAPEQSTVEIALRLEGDQSAVIEVRDHGPGLDESELEQIFEPFHRAHRSEPRGLGMGVGLAIARRIVEIHSGTIEARNADPEGLRITIVLPAALRSPMGI